MNDTVTEVKERPILFSTPMIRAILEGRKTVTRRVIKDELTIDMLNTIRDLGEVHLVYSEWAEDDAPKGDGIHKPEWLIYDEDKDWVYPIGQGYGKPGDILWVRETWSKIHYEGVDEKPTYLYKADEYLSGIERIWKPSIHMPRAACRLRLEIQSITVERLHDITEEDAIREGIEVKNDLRYHDRYDMTGYRDYGPPAKDGLPYWFGNAKDSFESLWTKINGAESWNANPWVWRIEFKRINQ